jgi:hypothetical protein
MSEHYIFQNDFSSAFESTMQSIRTSMAFWKMKHPQAWLSIFQIASHHFFANATCWTSKENKLKNKCDHYAQ